VTSGENEGIEGGGSEGSGNGVTSLGDVHLSMPSSVGLKGGEHSSLSTHVTECGLTGSMGSRSRHSGNTGNGSTGSPRFGTVFHTGINVNSVGLSGVFG